MSAVYKMDVSEPQIQEPTITVVETMPAHVRILGQNLRGRDIMIANKIGIPAHRALWRIYRKSLTCKTVFVGEEIVAIWGVTGTFLGRIGRPWFVASPFVEDYPTRLAFSYRRELKNMLKFFPVLEDWVSAEDRKTIRLLEILGFKFGEPQPMGDNKIMFMKATLER